MVQIDKAEYFFEKWRRKSGEAFNDIERKLKVDHKRGGVIVITIKAFNEGYYFNLEDAETNPFPILGANYSFDSDHFDSLHEAKQASYDKLVSIGLISKEAKATKSKEKKGG